MTSDVRVTIELGPKGKRFVAVAPDWPGLERGAKTEEAAIERLVSYLPRYEGVARRAGMGAEFSALSRAEVVQRYPGTGSTDFWGISFAFSEMERQAMSIEVLERDLRLMRASWTLFDAVRSRVSANLRKGPRGGGRDRDQIVRHTLTNELAWASGVGARFTEAELSTDEGLQAYRDAYCDGIRQSHAQGKISGTWPLRYLIRHTAYHTLDHAWEMVDKDLTDAS